MESTIRGLRNSQPKYDIEIEQLNQEIRLLSLEKNHLTEALNDANKIISEYES